MRRAKIVLTLGPAVASQEAVETLVAAGMDCARLNFSHGDHAGHREMAERVRTAARKHRRPVAILADLCGPKMRIGTFEDGSIELVEGASFRLSTDPSTKGSLERVSVTYDLLPRDVVEGDEILLDDGLMKLIVTGVEGSEVVTEVAVGGTLSNRKGLNLPGAKLSTPALTQKDREDLAFAVEELRTDYLALSFVRSPDDVREAQAIARGTPVIAKMEKPEAIRELEAIADVAEGMMVARGDLGVELGSEKVPLIQKRIIREANRRGKLVITATQMLDSMIRNPRPTRAEAADVANAVLDGTDAVMLSGETAAGRYPKLSVETMVAIIHEVEVTEERYGYTHRTEPDKALLGTSGWEISNAAGRAAALLSFVMELRAVVVFTKGGRTAQLLSEHRPHCPILAITPDPSVASRMALEWGVVPFVEVPPEDMEETLRITTALLAREGIGGPGDTVAVVSGWPPSVRPNTLKLHRLE